MLTQLIVIAQSIHTARAIIPTNGITSTADAVHTNAHMVTTSVDANAFEEPATRNAPMDITWTIQNAGADAEKLHLAVKAAAVMDMDTLLAAVITAN